MERGNYNEKNGGGNKYKATEYTTTLKKLKTCIRTELFSYIKRRRVRATERGGERQTEKRDRDKENEIKRDREIERRGERDGGREVNKDNLVRQRRRASTNLKS